MYAENTAAILYAKDHPNLAAHWLDVDGHGIQIGKITNHARTRLGVFQGIYDQLSQYTHPQARGLLASCTITEVGALQWSSAPHFKSVSDQLVTYAWVVELADATHHLLHEFAQQNRQRSFGQPGLDETSSPPSRREAGRQCRLSCPGGRFAGAWAIPATNIRSLRKPLPAGGIVGQGREAGVRLVAGAPLVPTGPSPRPLDRERSGMSSARSGGPGHADWRQGCAPSSADQ